MYLPPEEFTTTVFTAYILWISILWLGSGEDGRFTVTFPLVVLQTIKWSSLVAVYVVVPVRTRDTGRNPTKDHFATWMATFFAPPDTLTWIP